MQGGAGAKGWGRVAAIAAFLLLLEACAWAPAPRDQTGAWIAGLQCVPYARKVSGIQIYGDAWTWWDAAAGRYARGLRPAPSAVLVLDRTERMRLGHVAVVQEVLGPREILVTQANWLPGRITHEVRVVDVSPDNSWRLVRVWNLQARGFGRVNPSRGFIYPVQRAETFSGAGPA